MKKWNIPLGLMVGDVIHSFFSKPVTRQYPFVRREAPERFRGKLKWDLTNCTGCQLCVRDCPASALKLVVIDRAKKQFLMKFHADRCTFCSQCVVSCRFNCIQLSSNDWELAALSKEPFTILYGNANDIKSISQEADSE